MDLNRYFLQYVAIVLSGKKQIFISTFCEKMDNEGSWDEWRNHLQIVEDGENATGMSSTIQPPADSLAS